MQQIWRKILIRGVLFAGTVALTGCGGSSGDNSSTCDNNPPGLPPAQIAGTWTGELSYSVAAAGTDRTGTDTTTVVIAQDGSTVTGTVDGRSFSGTVTGNSIAITIPDYEIENVTMDAKVSACFDGTDLVNVNGQAEADAGPITVATGTIHSDRLTRE